MQTLQCHLCDTSLILDSKTQDDQATEFLTSGWSEAYDNAGKLTFTCPACLDQLKGVSKKQTPTQPKK